jgi:Nickel responsive protein SCO4226-like
MARFLAESYVPRSRADDSSYAARCARAAAEQLSREGISVRYVRTTLLPEDETCFHVFEALSAAAVGEVGRRAGLSWARIAPAVEDE